MQDFQPFHELKWKAVQCKFKYSLAVSEKIWLVLNQITKITKKISRKVYLRKFTGYKGINYLFYSLNEYKKWVYQSP